MVTLTTHLNNRQLWLRSTNGGREYAGWDFAAYCVNILKTHPADVLRKMAEEYDKKWIELNGYENMSLYVIIPSAECQSSTQEANKDA